MSALGKSILVTAGAVLAAGTAALIVLPDDRPSKPGKEIRWNKHHVDPALGELEDGGFLSPCACSTGSFCEWLRASPMNPDAGWVTAPRGVTLYPGMFRGTGCLNKPCMEMQGHSSWPKQCPVK